MISPGSLSEVECCAVTLDIAPATLVLWQDHVTAWLDLTTSIWTNFPELFAGRLVPVLGQIAGNPGPGMSRSIRLAISTEMRRDSIIRFRQINHEQRLADHQLPCLWQLRINSSEETPEVLC